MIWAGGRGGGISHPGLALGKFLTHRLAGENRRFFKHPGKSECVSDLCDFLTRTSFVQSKSLTTPPIRTTKDVSPCIALAVDTASATVWISSPFGSQIGILTYKLICENVCRVSSVRKKRESHFLFCTPHPCPEWGVSLYFEKCLPAFCVVGGIDCVRDSKVGTP